MATLSVGVRSPDHDYEMIRSAYHDALQIHDTIIGHWESREVTGSGKIERLRFDFGGPHIFYLNDSGVRRNPSGNLNGVSKG